MRQPPPFVARHGMAPYGEETPQDNLWVANWQIWHESPPWCSLVQIDRQDNFQLMRDLLVLAVHLLVTLAKLLRPGRGISWGFTSRWIAKRSRSRMSCKLSYRPICTRLHHSGDSCQICQFATHTLRRAGPSLKICEAGCSPTDLPVMRGGGEARVRGRGPKAKRAGDQPTARA